MASEELTETQSKVREFGYSVHDQCRQCSDALIAIGAFEHAETIIRCSREIIDAMQGIVGPKFLCTPAGR